MESPHYLFGACYQYDHNFISGVFGINCAVSVMRLVLPLPERDKGLVDRGTNED